MKLLKYILALFLITSLYTIQAQSFRSFITAGFNSSQIDGDNMGGYNKLGFAGGMGILNKFKSKKTSAQFEILYSRKGSRFNQNRDPFKIYRLNYVEIPVQLNYQFHKKTSLTGGLYYGRLINARFNDGYGYFDISKDIKKSDIGVTCGLLYKWADNSDISVRFSYTINTSLRGGFANNVITYTIRLYLDKQEDK